MQPTICANYLARSLIIGALSAMPSYAQIWVGPADGVWSNPGNWSTFNVPNSPFDDVVIDASAAQDSTVRLDTIALVRSMQINPADSLRLNPGSRLAVFGNGTTGFIQNAGLITLSPNTELLASASAVTLFGGGTIQLDGNAARIAGSGRVVNVDNRITGDGLLGGNAIEFVNQSIIDASTPNQALVVDPASKGPAALLNSGTLLASAGWLLLSGSGGGGFSNTSGHIHANGGTIQLINDAAIAGGTFQSSLGSRITIAPGHAASLTGIINNGHIAAGAGSTLEVAEVITNSGTFTLTTELGTTADTALVAMGDATFTGTGVIVLDSATAALRGPGTFINNPSHRIEGGGRVGDNSAGIRNHGVIVSRNPLAPLVIDPGSPMIHTGALIAAGETTLKLSGNGGQGFTGSGSMHIEAGGAIELVNAAQVSFTGDVQADGLLRAAGGSSLSVGGISGSGTVQATGQTTGGRITATHVRTSFIEATTGLVKLRAGGGTMGTSRVNQLNGSGLDLTDHAIIIDYTGTDPIHSLTTRVRDGYAAGSWSGNGIRSSSAAGDLTRRTGLGIAPASALATPVPGIYQGQPLDQTSVVIAFTLYGDANLDLRVNLDDFTALAAGFGNAGGWHEGDFNYDGFVNLNDFTPLAASFGMSAPLQVTTAAVPEPMTAFVSLALVFVGRSRRSAFPGATRR